MRLFGRLQNSMRKSNSSTAPAGLDYPLDAELSIRKQIGFERVDAIKETMIPIADFLAHKDACSFVLPMHGEFVPYETSAVLSCEIAVPAERFILEYRVKGPGEKADDPPERLAVQLLLVRRCPEQRELTVMELTRIYTDEPTWYQGMTDFKLVAGERIEFDGAHAKFTGKKRRSGTERVELAIRGGGSSHRILAQFLMLYNSPNISQVRVDAPHRIPNHYYRLRCEGPTNFAWLPDSGMQ
jgi:hypothetical protein